jgi:hypothetical protein
MMFDNEMLFRDGSTHMTAAMSGTYMKIPQGQFPLEMRLIVPILAETGDKIVATVTYSDDGTNAKEVVTLPDITYANVVTNKITEYGVPLFGRLYAKLDLAITDADTGSDFDAGHVIAGVVPAGRYTKRAYP